MRRSNKGISADRVRQVLRYEPDTGLFYWTEQAPRHMREGAQAGRAANSKGYHYISVDNSLCSAHRLAWLYTHGEMPEGQVDHIDGNPSNNRIANLRVVTPAQNTWNRNRSRRNKSGVGGVWFRTTDKLYQATISVNGKRHLLGAFRTVEEAASCRRAAEVEHWGEFRRTSG